MGLGLPLLKEAALQAGGFFSLRGEAGRGLAVTGEFQLDHLDRPPLGDLAETIAVFRLSYPEIRLVLYRLRGEKSYSFDSGPPISGGPGKQDRFAEVLKAREWIRQQEEQLMGG